MPVTEWFHMKGRFKHLTKQDEEGIMPEHQAQVDRVWRDLLAKEQASRAEGGQT